MKDSIVTKMNDLTLELLKKVSIQYKKLGFDMTPVQGRILIALSRQEKPLCQKDMETFIPCNKSTLSAILDTMEKNDLIKRSGSLEDSRRKVITLTKKSIKITELLETSNLLMGEVLCSNITEEEYIIFDKILEKIKKNMERM